MNFKYSILYVLVFSFLIFSCNSSKSINGITTSKIVKSRTVALNKALRKGDIYEYKILKRNNKKVLSKLSDIVKDLKLEFKDETIHILDNYDGGSNWYGGVLWVKERNLIYTYMLDSGEFKVISDNIDFSNYPSYATVNLELINFLRPLGSNIDFGNMPARGNSHSGYCIYTKIIYKGGEPKLESFAFRQW